MNYPEIDRLVSRYRDLAACRNDLEAAFRLLLETFHRSGLVLTCGNGTSGASARQLAGGLVRSFQRNRPVPEELRATLAEQGPAGERLAAQLQGSLPALALGGSQDLLTGIAAEQGAELMFAQQLYGLARPGDTLVVVSAGRTEDNLKAALRVATALDMTRIVLTGREDGDLDGLADCIVRVPRVTPLEIMELHLPVCHTLATMVEQEFFP